MTQEIRNACFGNPFSLQVLFRVDALKWFHLRIKDTEAFKCSAWNCSMERYLLPHCICCMKKVKSVYLKSFWFSCWPYKSELIRPGWLWSGRIPENCAITLMSQKHSKHQSCSSYHRRYILNMINATSYGREGGFFYQMTSELIQVNLQFIMNNSISYCLFHSGRNLINLVPNGKKFGVYYSPHKVPCALWMSSVCSKVCCWLLSRLRLQ